jgi:4'-phosphopantetheinyl transferase
VIEWLIQRSVDHPLLAKGVPPGGFLSTHETSVFDNLYSTKRREEWLLGRWTAKKLIQTDVEKSGRRLSCSEISILAGKDGAPVVWLGEGDRLTPANVTLSISHSKRASLCAIVRPGTIPLGADIEVIEPRVGGFAECYFTEEEKQTIRRAFPEHSDRLITAIWSGKEAALKAVRQGLRLDTHSLSCTFPSPLQSFAQDQTTDCWHPFTIQWRNGIVFPALAGWWQVWQEYILTLVSAAESKSGAECLWK